MADHAQALANRARREGLTQTDLAEMDGLAWVLLAMRAGVPIQAGLAAHAQQEVNQ